MLRLLFLFLLLNDGALSQEPEGSHEIEASGDLEDDEDRSSVMIKKTVDAMPGNIDRAKADEGSYVSVIVIAALCSVLGVMGVIVVIVLVRRHMLSQHHGIYAAPAEQAQKSAI